MNEHTPTPWKLGTTRKDGLLTLLESEDGFIAECDMGIEDNRDAANAAFIVRAVNAHDELVAALEGIEVIAGWCNSETFGKGIAEIWVRTRAALAKATA